MKLLFILFLIIVFLAGIYFIFNMKPMVNPKENMENSTAPSQQNVSSDCPNILLKKDDKFLLYNTNLPTSHFNPIPFASLDEYIAYLENQRKNGTNCPILFLQQENNTQGEDVYRIRPSPFDQQGGLPTITDINSSQLSQQNHVNTVPVQSTDASRENSPYNKNNYPSFDPHGQFIGVYTDMDEVHKSTTQDQISDNPMDPNWGGVEYTQQMVDSGKYIDYNITKPLLYQPKSEFNPALSNYPPPQDII